MSSAKWQILWSPSRQDRFIAFGNEICLYETVKSQESSPNLSGPRSQVMKLSDGSYASLVSVMSDIQFLKCVAWYPQPEPENLLAVGQANGRVLVTSIGSDNSPSSLNRGKEFVPRHSRQCNSLAWNPVNCNLLAAGLDKVRNDVSLMVWDISVQLSVSDNWSIEKRHSNAGGKQSPVLVPATAADQNNMGIKPLAELSTSEPTLSITWFANEPNKLFAGQAPKFLRIFDVRDPTRPHNAVVTKAVYGVSADPFSEHRIASFSEGQSSSVVIWDARNFDKPVISIPLMQKVTKIEWCPTRSGLLAALEYDSPVVRLFDMRHASCSTATYGSGFETESSVLGRCVQPTRSPLSSMSWHPTHENHMLTISPTGSIKDFTVFERISLTWSPSSHLMWGCGKHLLECSQQPPESIFEEDISARMKKRAMAGYGITVSQPGEIKRLTKDQKLVKLWTWINRVKDLRNKEIGQSIKCWNGIKTIMCGENSTAAVCTRSKVDSSGHETHLMAPVYQNEERKLALALCGWNFDGSKSLKGFIKQLQSTGQHERAAAVALFHSKLNQAIEILSSGAKSNNSQKENQGSTLNTVAMALSGYTVDKGTLWQKMCGTLCEQLESPYLRSIFSFLTSEDNFDDILAETEIEIEDRIAFACKYLPDDKLAKYLELLSARMKEMGDLDGLILTGITGHGVDLLEKYVNKTTDVQTAALVMLNTIPDLQPEVMKDRRVLSWTENYRNLLDTWRMWHQRAQFDIHHNSRDSSQKPAQQVFVTCNYCGNSILTNVQSSAARPRRLAQYCNPSNRTKILACPGCRKPLPRCALCLVHMGSSTMGSTNSASNDTNVEKPSNVRALNPFSNWFTWCQSCRHGGHASHFTDWFKEHTDCPVTGCDCHCMTLDSVAMATPEDISPVS